MFEGVIFFTFEPQHIPRGSRSAGLVWPTAAASMCAPRPLKRLGPPCWRALQLISPGASAGWQGNNGFRRGGGGGR